jgi:carbamoylphosphate synthase large subunit
MKPVLLVLASGDAEYREYVMRHLSIRYRLILLSPYPPTWERPYIIDHVQINPADADDVIMTAVKVSGRAPVAGAVTYHEPCVGLVAVIAEKLGLPHCDPRAAGLCRDKFAAREAFQRAHVPSARYQLAGDADEAHRAATEIGYPLVVKPRALSASFGVSLVRHSAELETAFNCARSKSLPEPWEHRRGVLLEEYLDGPEVSVDSAVWQGRVEPVIYARKLLGFAPFFEEEGHIVGPPEAIVPDPDAVRSIVQAAHRALGFDNGVTHTEIRLTASGPRVVEVNGRSGGDLIPYLAYLAAGVDIPLAIGDIAVGAEPDLSAVWNRVAGVRFFYPPSPGRLVSAEVRDPGGERPSWLHQVTWMAESGTEFHDVPGSLYFARAGFAIVTASTVQQCAERLSVVKDQATLVLEPF